MAFFPHTSTMIIELAASSAAMTNVAAFPRHVGLSDGSQVGVTAVNCSVCCNVTRQYTARLPSSP